MNRSYEPSSDFGYRAEHGSENPARARAEEQSNSSSSRSNSKAKSSMISSSSASSPSSFSSSSSTPSSHSSSIFQYLLSLSHPPVHPWHQSRPALGSSTLPLIPSPPVRFLEFRRPTTRDTEKRDAPHQTFSFPSSLSFLLLGPPRAFLTVLPTRRLTLLLSAPQASGAGADAGATDIGRGYWPGSFSISPSSSSTPGRGS
jgi:hypothetical protein